MAAREEMKRHVVEALDNIAIHAEEWEKVAKDCGLTIDVATVKGYIEQLEARLEIHEEFSERMKEILNRSSNA
jgi:hypothetical protein